jgi:hypothetical protein
MLGSTSSRLPGAFVATGTLLLAACADAPSAPRTADPAAMASVASRPSAPPGRCRPECFVPRVGGRRLGG